MRPQSLRLRFLLLPALACLAQASGCERVHSRQWGYPNARKGLARVGKARSPQVNLRFEANPTPGADGATARVP